MWRKRQAARRGQPYSSATVWHQYKERLLHLHAADLEADANAPHEFNLSNDLLKPGDGDNSKLPQLDLVVNAMYRITLEGKDLAGNTTQYRLMTKSEFKIISNKEEINFLIKENFDMKNFNDEFEEKKYEDTIKENFAKSISNKLLLQISRLK